jgi:hypothetical protein
MKGYLVDLRRTGPLGGISHSIDEARQDRENVTGGDMRTFASLLRSLGV